MTKLVYMEVTIHYHIGSDHKGVKYSWSCSQGHAETSLQEPLPHRALSLKRVIEYNREIFQEFAKEDLEGPNTFPKWDTAKRLIRTHAIKAWGDKVRTRGKHLKDLQSRALKMANLHSIPLLWLNRNLTCRALILLR
jgi:hypothetical protein